MHSVRATALGITALTAIAAGCGPTQPTLSTTPPPYLEVAGSLWDSGFDDEVFAICAQLPSKMDARNLYLWAQNVIFELRNEIVDKPPARQLQRKPVVGYLGEIWCDGERIRFAAMRIEPYEPATAVDAIIIDADAMQSKLDRWLRDNPLPTKQIR